VEEKDEGEREVQRNNVLMLLFYL